MTPVTAQPARFDLPASIAADPLVAPLLEPAGSLDEALALTRRLATGHYENFSVVSLLLPRRLRQHFSNIYAFCRIADDLGDEAGSPAAASVLLSVLREQTIAAYRPGSVRGEQGGATTEVALFTALRHTIDACEIPPDPFLDLISAFEQDQHVTRYETAEQLIDYCRRSANPVGRLVLYMCGYRDEHRQRLADQTCTGLQIINFCQDVRRDLLELNRVYIPRQSLRQAGTDLPEFEEAVRRGTSIPAAAREAIRIETDRAAAMFAQGETLIPLLSPDVRGQIRLFTLGGQAIVKAIRRRGHDTLTGRPVLSKRQKAGLIVKVLSSTIASRLVHRSPEVGTRAGVSVAPARDPGSSTGPREVMT